MIVLLFAICGLAGLAAGALLAGGWVGAAMLFGFAPPTSDQVTGLIILTGVIGCGGSAALFGIMILYEDWKYR